LSDLHVDMSQDAMTRLMPILKEMNYDLCVLTGDYRGQTFGSYEATLVGMSQICAELKRPAYGVLGNHDTVCMLQDLEEMGIRMLLGSVLPRHMGCGPWKYRNLIGYTSVGAGSSVVPVRFNCPPEITLHYLQSSE